MRRWIWWVIGAALVAGVAALTVWLLGRDSQPDTAAQGQIVEGDIWAYLPAPGTDSVEFVPAADTVLADTWPGAVDETGGGRVVADVQVLAVAVDPGNFSLTSSQIYDTGTLGWQATVTLAGTPDISEGQGFLLPPGRDVFPDGVVGRVTAVTVASGQTELTLEAAALDTLFSELHLAYRGTSDVVVDGQDGGSSTAGGTAAIRAPRTWADLFECDLEATKSTLTEWEVDPGESLTGEVQIADLVNPTFEISGIDTGFQLDISGSGVSAALGVGWDLNIGMNAVAGFEGSCQVSDAVMAAVSKEIPLGASGALLEVGPELGVSFTHEGSMDAGVTLYQESGFTFADGAFQGYRTQEVTDSYGGGAQEIEVALTAGVRGALSFMTVGGGYLSVEVPVAVTGTGEVEATEAEVSVCAELGVKLDLNLGMFLDIFFQSWEEPILSVSVDLWSTPLGCLMGDSDDDAASGATPAELWSGTWCNVTDAGDCLSLEGLQAQYPEGGFPDGQPVLGEEKEIISFCLGYDLGEEQCSMANSVFFTYYPAGVEWNCQEEAAFGDPPACDPDYTDAHDARFPRLVRELNHQQGEQYADAPPYYLEEDLAQVDYDASSEDANADSSQSVTGTAVDPADYVRSPNADVTYAFTTPSGLHSCAIIPTSGQATGSVACSVSFDESVDVPEFDVGIAMPYVSGDGSGFAGVSDSAYGGASMDPPVLEYGQTLTAYGITCGVSEEGIHCASANHWMKVSAAGYEFDE